jgi:hypothetical protein
MPKSEAHECEGWADGLSLAALAAHKHQGYAAGILPVLDGPPQVCDSSSPSDRPAARRRKLRITLIITVLHGHHRPQEWPVIDSLRQDQYLALQQPFWSTIGA